MRPLSPDEAALWARVMAQVRPLRGTSAPVAIAKASSATPAGAANGTAAPAPGSGKAPASHPAPVPAPGPAGGRDRSVRPQRLTRAPDTLDGTWDRQLSRGLVSPDRTIDLHGHTLHSAHTLLDTALDIAIRAGDRVMLLVTGKPPRPTSERPHAPHAFRGAIRAAVGDWLAGSRHAAAIAAVRGAHPRHGGAGALYVVLRRPRGTSRKS